MGVVYEVRDKVRGHHVALKTIRQASADGLYRLKREFRALTDLSHPNLVDLYDLVVEGDAAFFTMELIDGVDVVRFCRGGGPADAEPGDESKLTERYTPSQPPPSADPLEPNDYADPHGSTATGAQPTLGLHFDEGRLRSCLAQLAAGLQALHAAGKVHRDIKPSNVLVAPDGRVVLLDFGLVSEKTRASAESLDGQLVGTVAYMSPEQAAQSPGAVTAASDCYSMGVLLYEVLTGELPHGGSMVEVLLQKQTTRAPAPSTLVKGIPRDLDDLCLSLLAISPEERPTAAQVLVAMGQPAKSARPDARSVDLTQTTPFTGRARELALLAEAATSVEQGRPAIAHVRGPSGIGKSALIEEFLGRMQADCEVTVLTGRCYEQEFVPFKAFDGLIDGLSRVWRRMPEAEAVALLPRAASSLARLFPVLGRVPAVAGAPQVRESPDPLEARTRAFAALREVLQRLGDRERVVLFLDDLQWADADTLTLLAEVMREPDPPRILLILSHRTESAGAEALEELAGRMAGRAFDIDVAPLSMEESSDLVHTLAGAVDAELADRLAREAAGSPFLLGEIVRYLQSTDGIDSSQLNIDTVVRQRIELLPDSARALLEIAAVSGTPLSVRDAGAVASAGPEQVARDVRLLRVNHLLRHPGGRGDNRIEPYHDRIRQAILSILPEPRTREVHRALALALEGRAPSAWLARHWAGAGEASKAATHARRAADDAWAAFDFDQASELYRTVLDLADLSGEARRDLRVRLGESLSNAGRSAEAAEVFLEVAAASQAVERLDYRRQAAQHLLNAGLIERGLEVLTEVLAEIGERMPATPRRALLSFIWSYANIRLHGIRWKPRDESEIPPRDLFRLDVYNAVSLSLGMVDTIRGATYQARGLRLALRIGESRGVFRMLVLHTIFVCSQGGRNLSRAEKLVAITDDLAKKSGEPFERAYALVLHGFHSYFRGRFNEAIGHLDAAEELLRTETTGTFAELNHVRIFRLQCLLYQGNCKELIEHFEEHMRDARVRGDYYVMTVLTRSVNVRWLASDDAAAAQRALDQSRWIPPEEAFHLQHWYEMRAKGEIDLYSGNPEEMDLQLQRFAQLGTSKLTRVQVVRAGAAWLRARLALATGAAPWDPVREARSLERERFGHYLAWAAIVRAGVAHRDGAADTNQAYEKAAQVATENELVLPAAACRRRRGELIGGEEGARLVAEADAAMRELGVRNPERMTGVIAPLPRSR